MSQNNDLFGYEDIFEDNKSKADFAALIGVIIRLILAVTTGGFFFLYVGDLFAWLAGDLYSPYLSALTGVFCIDGLAYFWSKLRQRSGNTETQLTAATLGTIGNILLSVLVTVVFIILLTDFVAVRDTAGQLNDVGQAVNIAGLLVATIAIGGNGVLWAYYDANSPAVRQALSSAKLGAARFAGQFAIQDRQNRMTIGRTLEELYAALPRYTNDAAKRNRAQYLLDNFKDIDADGDGRLSDQEIEQHGGKRYTLPNLPGRDAYIVWRKLPGRQGWKEVGRFDSYTNAVGNIQGNAGNHAAGTKYKIASHGNDIRFYEVDGNGHAIEEFPNAQPPQPPRPLTPRANGRPHHEATAPAGPAQPIKVIRRLPGPAADITPETIGEFTTLTEARAHIEQQLTDTNVPDGTIYRIYQGGTTIDALRVQYLPRQQAEEIISLGEEQLRSTPRPTPPQHFTE